MTEYTICPKVVQAWTNIMISEKTKTIDCSVKPYKFFDQIILEEHEKGCRYFFCEMGRGEDSDSYNPTHKAIKKIQEKITLEPSDMDMRGKYCVITFGVSTSNNYLGITYDKKGNKFFDFFYKFDEELVDKISAFWLRNESILKNIKLYFIDMTQGNIDSPLLKLFEAVNAKPNYNIQILKMNYPSGKFQYMDMEKRFVDCPEIIMHKFIRIYTTIYPDLIDRETLDDEFMDIVFMNSGKTTSYAQKYLKYKAKYLELKNKLNK
jgi:hypothetical protein